MRIVSGAVALVLAGGIGFMSGRAPSAAASDEHAGPGLETQASGRFNQAKEGKAFPASGATAAERIAKSPRHAEWVAIKVGATDSVMAWVVYPERRDKAPVVIAIHENTGINTWTRGVADQLAADGFIGIAPDLTTMFRRDADEAVRREDRKSTRLNSSHSQISYAVFCLKKKKKYTYVNRCLR